MLVRIDYANNDKSVYKCDKCNLIISNRSLSRVIFNNKTYHLCKKHAALLKKWIDNNGE